jgi:dipeptidyl aminopeptidase/acylaminoacyl peptidase
MHMGTIKKILSIAIAFTTYIFLAPSVQAPIAKAPLEILFGGSANSSPQISPDGSRIAYLASFEGKRHVWIKTIGCSDDHPVLGLSSDFSWAPDGKTLLYTDDTNGDENYHIYSIDLKSGDTRDLTPFENVQAKILAVNYQYPHDILVLLNRDNPAFHDVYKIDLVTGQTTLIEKNPGDVIRWINDKDLGIRGKITVAQGGSNHIWIRLSNTQDWKRLCTWELDDTVSSRIVGFNKNGSALYTIDSRNINTAALKHIDCATGQEHILYQNPLYDLEQALTHPETGEPYGVVYTGARKQYVALNSAFDASLHALKNIDSGDCEIVSSDKSNNLWTVAFVHDNVPTTYYLFNLITNEVTFLFSDRPKLSEYSLAATDSFSLTSRDGLKLEGYVTYPLGVEHKDLPMVLTVHGGPWSRDKWGDSLEPQWLANRGYMCVQVNFRGSTGYGKSFVKAANKEWGGKMHQDLIDTVNYFIETGEADPQRVAIYGGSYGGYAALCGAAFTPDVFRCAIDLVGISSLLTFIASFPEYWKLELEDVYQRIGNPSHEQDFLKSRSPLYSADAIKIPLLIAQGGCDPRVKKAEAEQLVAALQSKGIPYEYLLFSDEGHGFSKFHNRKKFYEAVESFLECHLLNKCA